VELILRRRGSGLTPGTIIADHPRPTQTDVLAAQAFPADDLSDEELVYG
jgi:uncharacterized protein (DUF433 family)